MGVNEADAEWTRGCSVGLKTTDRAEAKREADAAPGRERRQRWRTAAEKLRMEEEFSTISKQLKILDMSNRAER